MPLGLMFFNYRVDPNNRYHFELSEQHLAVLSRSPDRLLTVAKNYDDRIFLKKFIASSPKPSFLIMGGSRVLSVQSEMLRTPYQNRFLNAGLTAATVRDYIAVWQILKNQRKIPDKILLSVAPQAVNGYTQNELWLSLVEYYLKFWGQENGIRLSFLRWTSQIKDLFSFETTRESFRRMGNPRLSDRLMPRSRYDGKQYVRTSSFARLSPEYFWPPSEDLVRMWAESTGEEEAARFKIWNCLDETGFDHLGKLIHDMKRHGCRVALVAMPYHPIVYDRIQNSSKAFQNLQYFSRRMRQVAEQEGILFYDALGVKQDGTDAHDFFDAVHLKPDTAYLLFRDIDRAAGWDIFADSFEGIDTLRKPLNE